MHPLSLQGFLPEQALLCAGQQQGAYLDSIGMRCGPGSPGKAGKFWSWSLQELGVICDREGGGGCGDKALHTLQCGCWFDGGKGEALWVVSSCS